MSIIQWLYRYVFKGFGIVIFLGVITILFLAISSHKYYAKGYLDTKTEIPFATFAAALKRAGAAAANNTKASSVPAPGVTGFPAGACAAVIRPQTVRPT